MPVEDHRTALHVWEVESANVDKCARCERRFHRLADGSCARHCFPSSAWMRDHPDDSGRCDCGLA
jgi:ribosomal protein L37E